MWAYKIISGDEMIYLSWDGQWIKYNVKNNKISYYLEN